MSDLPVCPCCNGILNVPRHYRLTSACRCGYPQKVTWDDFAETRGDPFGKAIIAHDLADAMDRLVERATNSREREAGQQSPEQS